MGRDRAAYMREYRARRKEDLRLVLDVIVPAGWEQAAARIAELEAEIKHLKAELAKRPPTIMPGLHQYSTRPFTPVPKK